MLKQFPTEISFYTCSSDGFRSLLGRAVCPSWSFSIARCQIHSQSRDPWRQCRLPCLFARGQGVQGGVPSWGAGFFMRSQRAMLPSGTPTRSRAGPSPKPCTSPQYVRKRLIYLSPTCIHTCTHPYIPTYIPMDVRTSTLEYVHAHISFTYIHL
jgi:hypothetical protein